MVVKICSPSALYAYIRNRNYCMMNNNKMKCSEEVVQSVDAKHGRNTESKIARRRERGFVIKCKRKGRASATVTVSEYKERGERMQSGRDTILVTTEHRTISELMASLYQ